MSPAPASILQNVPAAMNIDGYRTIRSSKWTCKGCAQVASPTCVKCQTRTWDGYNIPKDGFPDILMGKWLCASCWTSSPVAEHQCWKEWFTRRAEHYPDVCQTQETQGHKTNDFVSYDWMPGQVRSGAMDKPSDRQSEYPLGKRGWRKLKWHEFPPSDECATVLDADFFRCFLQSRTSFHRDGTPGEPLSEQFAPPERKSQGWVYHAKKFHSIRRISMALKAKTWKPGYHASRFTCAHSILCKGLKNAVRMKSKNGHYVPGVYHFDTLGRGCSYHYYQLFADGTAWCIVWHILTDPKKIRNAGDEQRATLQEGVEILGAYTRGFTYAQLEGFMKEPADTRPCLTFLSQWKPELEHPAKPWFITPHSER